MRVKLGNQGFSMIELLVVLLIIGILAAVAAPMFLGNSSKAKASEAVSTLGAIRDAERTYRVSHSIYLDGSLYTAGGAGTSIHADLGVTPMANVKYFSMYAFSVDKTNLTMKDGTVGKDYVITANGDNSCGINATSGGTCTDDAIGARNAGDAANIAAQMDNSGHVIWSSKGIGAGASDWVQY